MQKYFSVQGRSPGDRPWEHQGRAGPPWSHPVATLERGADYPHRGATSRRTTTTGTTSGSGTIWEVIGSFSDQVPKKCADLDHFCVAVSRFFENPIQIIFSENILVTLRRLSRVRVPKGPGGYMRKH